MYDASRDHLDVSLKWSVSATNNVQYFSIIIMNKDFRAGVCFIVNMESRTFSQHMAYCKDYAGNYSDTLAIVATVFGNTTAMNEMVRCLSRIFVASSNRGCRDKHDNRDNHDNRDKNDRVTNRRTSAFQPHHDGTSRAAQLFYRLAVIKAYRTVNIVYGFAQSFPRLVKQYRAGTVISKAVERVYLSPHTQLGKQRLLREFHKLVTGS